MAFVHASILLLAVLTASAMNTSMESCNGNLEQPPAALLQRTKAKALHDDDIELDSKPHSHRSKHHHSLVLTGNSRQPGAGSTNSLDEDGYQQCASLCCHHEMTVFVTRVIASMGRNVCDTQDLLGMVHWFDCTNDNRDYAALVAELERGSEGPCPWLGTTFCKTKSFNCNDTFAPCPKVFDPNSEPGATADLSDEGYAKVALRCCDTEMKAYMLREIHDQGLEIVDNAALLGLLHWYDCTTDNKTYTNMSDEIAHAYSGNPCPWLKVPGEAAPARAQNCPTMTHPRLEGLDGPNVPDPAHRRRTHCR